MRESGRTFLFDHWSDFEKKFTSEHLHHAPNHGTTPFFWLARAVTDGDLRLFQYWDKFKQGLTAERLHRVIVKATNGDLGTTPFYWLISTKEGLQFVVDHWIDFKENLTTEGLNQVTKGITPLNILIFHSKGLNLIMENSRDFWPHMTYLQKLKIHDHARLHRVTFANITDEDYYTLHPTASGLPTMRYEDSALLAHGQNVDVRSKDWQVVPHQKALQLSNLERRSFFASSYEETAIKAKISKLRNEMAEELSALYTQSPPTQ